MDSTVTRWRRKKWELYAVTFYERSTLLNSKWINFHLPRFIQSRKRFLIRPPLEEIMATFSVPAIKMLRGFYYPSFPFLLSFSRFSSLEIVDFDPREAVSLITSPSVHLCYSFIIRGTLKNTTSRVFALFLLLYRDK